MLCDSEKRYVQPQAVSQDGLGGPMISGYLYRSGRQNIPKKEIKFREWGLPRAI